MIYPLKFEFQIFLSKTISIRELYRSVFDLINRKKLGIMKIIALSLIAFFSMAFAFDKNVEENTRYILIEAPCKPEFNALPEFKEKVIITKVFKAEFETPFDMVNAEPQLIIDFEVALEKAYPNSRNQIKDILVYMLTTEKEAKELYKRKEKLFKTLETGVIKLKIK